MNKCVYLHKDINGVVKYVGSGTKERPYSKINRNNEWLAYFSTEPPEVEIVANNLSRYEAIEIEREYYFKHKDTLLNKVEPKQVKILDFDIVNKYFYVDETSKCGLRLKYKNQHNTTYNVGDEVGATTSSYPNKKYWTVSIDGRSYSAHRIIYLLINKSLDPDKVINHIDGNGLNNKISNLEEVSHSINSLKKKKPKHCNVEHIGISDRFYKGNFDSYLTKFKFGKIDIKQRFSLSAFKSKEAALKAAIKFREYCEIKYGEFPKQPDEFLCKEVEGILRKVESIRSLKVPEQLKNGKWVVKMIFKRKRNTITNLPSYEDAIIARDKFIEEHNNNLIITLP